MSLQMGERDSRTEARPRARPELQITFNRFLSLFLLSVYVISLVFFLISSAVSLCLSNISCFFLAFSHSVSNFSRLHYFDPPLKECHVQAKAILWLFFERGYFMPLCNIKSRLNKRQSWKLNFCLYFQFYCASNQFCFSGKALKSP